MPYYPQIEFIRLLDNDEKKVERRPQALILDFTKARLLLRGKRSKKK